MSARREVTGALAGTSRMLVSIALLPAVLVVQALTGLFTYLVGWGLLIVIGAGIVLVVTGTAVPLGVVLVVVPPVIALWIRVYDVARLRRQQKLMDRAVMAEESNAHGLAALLQGTFRREGRQPTGRPSRADAVREGADPLASTTGYVSLAAMIGYRTWPRPPRRWEVALMPTTGQRPEACSVVAVDELAALLRGLMDHWPAFEVTAIASVSLTVTANTDVGTTRAMVRATPESPTSDRNPEWTVTYPHSLVFLDTPWHPERDASLTPTGQRARLTP